MVKDSAADDPLAEAAEAAAQSGDRSDNDGKAEALAKELEKARNDFLYLRADFDNYKKNVIRERSELVKYGSQNVFVELLEVVDNFERALSSQVKSDNIESFKQGLSLIAQELRALLTRFGVSELPSEGVKFDPNLHNALGTEPSAAVPPGHITKVLKKPYRLHDRTIRPGQVIIATEVPSEKKS